MQVSIWEKESFFNHKDVIIVGSGFAGLWCALELKKNKPSLNICIVDRGIIPMGASTRNAGFSCFGSLSELVSDAASMGDEKMLELVKMRYKGLKKIRRTFGAAAIDYKNYGGYELFTENGTYDISNLEKDVKNINKLLKRVLKEDRVFRIADKKIKKFGFAGISRLIESPLEGQLHSGKLTQALLLKTAEKGIETLSGLEITGFENSGKQVLVQTNQHFSLSTDRLLICTNAFTDKLLPGIEVTPARGQVLVTSEIPDLRIKGSFHFDEGYYYFRNLGKRVLLGGARNKFFAEEKTTALTTSHNIQAELERFLKDVLLPGENDFSIDYRWSGIMGMGSEKLPVVKQVHPNVFCAVAMGGIGVATAPVVAEQITQIILKTFKA